RNHCPHSRSHGIVATTEPHADTRPLLHHSTGRDHIVEGERVTVADIDGVLSVEPEGIGSNSGYVCFAVANGYQCIKFDFRYNRERVARLLLRARQFFDTAADCLESRAAVACDLAFSAAELSI
uniref:hypothetical protein n=1 Tax=Mycobacterium avium TaxID=1764 RepID=UPI001E5D989D